MQILIHYLIFNALVSFNFQGTEVSSRSIPWYSVAAEDNNNPSGGGSFNRGENHGGSSFNPNVSSNIEITRHGIVS